MSKVVERAERILAWHQAQNREVARRLRPGLARQEIEHYEKRLGWELPREAYDFYGWRNGVDHRGAKMHDDLCFYPGFFPLSLEEATAEIAKKLAFGLPLWQAGWLPLFGDVSDARDVLDCTRIVGGSAPVIFYMGQDTEHPDQYLDLGTMLETLAECFVQGAFFVDQEGLLDMDWDGYSVVGRKTNPGVDFWE